VERALAALVRANVTATKAALVAFADPSRAARATKAADNADAKRAAVTAACRALAAITQAITAREEDTDMSKYADFDGGGADSGDGEIVWLNWHPQATRDGISGACFSVRDAAGRAEYDLTGAAFDLPSMKTGWGYSSGQKGARPEYRWGESLSRRPVRPGDDWKPALQLRVVLADGRIAVWRQHGLGAWIGVAEFMRRYGAEADHAAPKLQVVQCRETKEIDTRAGSTIAPVFEVAGWIKPPACLTAGGAEPRRLGRGRDAELDDDVPF
jgi:hypothetical protein